MPPIRIHAHGVPLACPGKLTLNDKFVEVDLDALDPETAEALRNYRDRHVVAAAPDHAAAFQAWGMVPAAGPDMAAPPAVTASVVDDTATTKEERPSRKR